jgi:hypothetical protein
LQAANTAVEQAFNAVLDSEKAGANVNGLLTLLNVAAGDLAQAENSYHSGDSNKAIAQVGIVSQITQEVTNSAQNAKHTALVSRQQTFWFTIAFSVIESSVLILILSLVWRRLKRGYMEKVPSLTHEVALN